MAIQTKIYLFFLDIKSTDPFSYIDSLGISKNSSLRGNAASLYRLFMTIGVTGLVITLLLCAVKLSLYKNGKKKSEVKETIGLKLLISIGFFGFVFFAGLVLRIIKSIAHP